MNMMSYMQRHRAATEAPAFGLNTGDYEDEVLHAGWNPAVPYLNNDVVRYARSPEATEYESTVDVDAFLDRVYAGATQI